MFLTLYAVKVLSRGPVLMFKNIKKKKFEDSLSESITLKQNTKNINIIPIGFWIQKNIKLLKLVNKNRRKFNHFFLNDISNSISKTKKFFNNILYDKNICLFLINSKKYFYEGIIGAKYENKKIEIYFVLKLNKTSSMKESLGKIINFLKDNYKIKEFIVKVISNNYRAKKLYFNKGFKKYKKHYLKKVKFKGLYKHEICKKKFSNVDYFYEILKLSF